MVAAFAEFEHSMMVSRTRDGLAAARARGRNGGRPSKLSNKQIDEIKKMYLERRVPVQTIAELFSVSRPTIYRVLDQLPGELSAKPPE
jgi:DNA invertase Pin-like site-specific DNA recombinase